MLAGVCDAAEELGRYGVAGRLLPSQASGFPMWLIDTRGLRTSALAPLLSDEEGARAARFRAEALRDRYIAAHGSLKVLLHHCYGIAPNDQFQELNAFGKPRLKGIPQVHYSMSYSANHVLIGLNEGAEIGVDVEALRSISDAADLADMHYTATERAEVFDKGLSGLDLSREFLNVWVRKEACVKAFGQGLGVPLNDVECAGGTRTKTVRLGGGRYETGLIQTGGDPIMAWARSVQTYESVTGSVSK